MELVYEPNMPFGSLRHLSEQGVESLYHENVPGLGYSARLDAIAYGTGAGNLIIQVNDCETETDWTESDNGEWDVGTFGSTYARVGTNCTTFEASDSGMDNTQYVDTIFINQSYKIGQDAHGLRQMDWRDTRYLGFWITADTGGHFNAAGEMTVAIVNAGTVQTKVSVKALVGTEHQHMQVDMEANSWVRDRVESLRFYCNNAATQEIYVDDIKRYALSYDQGPFYGCMWPVKSGTVLANGDTVAWSIDGLVKEGAAAADTLGPVILFRNGAAVSSGTGTAKRDLMGMIPGYYIFIGQAGSGGITAGDYVEWESNGYYTDVSDTTTEYGFAKALETAGAQYDDVFLVATLAGASN